jgi:uncharacterized protein (TIGR03032 family)
MKLPREFIRLPFAFDAARLQHEVDAIEEAAWRPHPQGFRGNSALLLVASDGDPANDAIRGHQRETPLLRRLPYLRQVLSSFGSTLGRTRLMRIDEHEEVEPHCDVHYYWREHLRIHVPIRTDPAVEFFCGERSLHMAEGECWVFDTWRTHRVANPSGRRRIHLVADTRGSPALWERIEAALQDRGDVERVAFDPAREVELATEGDSMPVVMSPLEMADHAEAVVEEMRRSPACPAGAAQELQQALAHLRNRWQRLWQVHAASEEGWPHYRALVDEARARAAAIPPDWRLANGTRVADALAQWIFGAALNPELAQRAHLQRFVGREIPQPPALESPVFIVAAPRSGSTLLFETLSRCADLWTVGGESHGLIEGIPSLSPAAHGWASNRLEAEAATPEVVALLHRRIAALLRDRDGLPWTPGSGAVRLLEKTPKNALRIPFLAQAFPTARFVYLVREPRANVSSILEAWRSGQFVTYEKLPDWKGGRWSLLLVPGWRELEGRSLAEVAVAQYRAAHEAIQADLAALPAQRWCAVSYEDLVADPRAQIARLSRFLDLHWDRPAPRTLPASVVTLTAPSAGKWRRNEDALAPHFPIMQDMAERIERFTGLALAEPASVPAPDGPGPTPAPDAKPDAARAATTTRPAPPSAPAAAAAADPQTLARVRALASVHTQSFAQVLRTAGVSLAVSTYQAGKLVLIRHDGDGVNTAFKEMRKPMGIALEGSRLAIGTQYEVQHFQAMPALVDRLEPRGRVDGAWLPRASHVTGNIDIHELAYAGGTLWGVNTRFCCLCTFDPGSSFVPHWRPSFLTALAPEDRCHLNGLGVRDQQVRYVTLLGRSDAPGGWRERKADGGELIDLRGERVLCEGLSMPHSPRWYRDRLWVLESGNGGLCRVDPDTGERETVVELPGFTRGLDFHGPLAFIGLSQVRESAVFAKLPLTERLSERICGVWVVNIEQGRIVAFLRFEDAVQEIFAVTVLPNARYPELVLPGDALVADAFVLPDAALADVPQARRAANP